MTEPTIRARAEAIRDERNRVHSGDPFLAFVQSMHLVAEHAQAILDALDEARRQEPSADTRWVCIRDFAIVSDPLVPVSSPPKGKETES